MDQLKTIVGMIEDAECIDASEDDYLREMLLTEAFNSKMVAVDTNNNITAFISNLYIVFARIETVCGIKTVSFYFIGREKEIKNYHFFMNASSVKDLGNYLRTVKRVNMDEVFNIFSNKGR